MLNNCVLIVTENVYYFQNYNLVFQPFINIFRYMQYILLHFQ